PYRFNCLAISSDRLRQTKLNFGPKPQDIPTKGIGDSNRTIGKAMNFLEAHAFAIPKPTHHAPTLRAQVDTQIAPCFHKRSKAFTSELCLSHEMVMAGFDTEQTPVAFHPQEFHSPCLGQFQTLFGD